jgi:hypothetical protein
MKNVKQTCRVGEIEYVLEPESGDDCCDGCVTGCSSDLCNALGDCTDGVWKLAAIAELKAACKRVRDWLSSFSMPPTSTIAEKQEHMAILEAAIAKAEQV